MQLFGSDADHLHFFTLFLDLLVLHVLGLESELVVLMVGVGDTGACRKGQSECESCDKGKVSEVFHNAVMVLRDVVIQND